MMVAGMRTAYGDTLFMKRYFKQFRTPLRLNNLRRTVRQGSGLKFAAAWQGIEESFRDRWAEEDALRGDPTPLRTVSPEPRYYTGYFGTVTDGANLYSFKSGLTNPGQLVRTAPDGTETPLRPLSSHASNLAFDRTGGRIFFSEPVPHPRWGLAMTSRIRYADAEGRISDLTDTGRYYNPVLSPDDRQIAFVEYPRQGGSILHIRSLDEDAAELLYTAPDGLQIVECVLTGQEAVFSGLSEEGFGLYAFSSRPGSPSPVRTVLAPQPVRVKNLKYTAQGILLTCDRTGIDDIYCLDPADGTLRQLTQSRYGADYAVFNDACDTLYYSALTPAGRLLHATAAKDLAWKPADFTQRAAYPVAALLSAQEAALAAENPVQAADGTLSDPVPYPKAAHLLKLHSWLPFYSDSGGVDYGYDKQGAVSAFPGVTFLFQNLLGNATGMISYAGTMKERLQWSPDLSAITTEKQFRNSFHARFTYSGFYPVIEVGADVNNRPAYAYGRLQTGTGEAATLSVVSPFLHKVYAQGNLRISVPLNFSQRGWDRELVPQVIWSLSNDSVTGNVWQRDANPETEAGSLPLPYTPPVPVATDDVHRLLHRFTLALRGSVTRSSAASPSFPRLGIGFEGGARAYTAASWAYSPRVFGRIYGYLPGLTSMQGMMLSASAVHCFRDFNLIGDDFDVFPRGYAENALGALADFYCGTRAGFTFDYSIPFLSLDRNISSLFYIRNLEAVPFADLTWLRFSQPPTARPSGSTLYSVGGDLLLNLGKVLMVRNSLKCGIRLAYNGGSAFETFRQWDPNLSHGYVHLVVRTDLTETSGLHR